MNWTKCPPRVRLNFALSLFLICICLPVGNAHATAPNPFLQLSGEASRDLFGGSVAGVGDVNGDGYEDLLVGAHGLPSQRGKAYVYFGGPHADSIPDVVLVDDGLYTKGFGFPVAGVGDVNGDGRSDMAVGEPFGNFGTGRAQLFFGGSTIHSRADVRLSPGYFSSADRFGWFTASAGDLNGDGYGDLLVGAPRHLDNAASSLPGRAYVFFGAAMPDTTPDAVIETPTSPPLYDQIGFGFSGGMVGDINGDGKSDLVIAQGIDPRVFPRTGAAFLYLGGKTVGSAPDAKLESRYYPGSYGVPGAVVGAGDLNVDGYDDFLVEGSWWQTDGSNSFSLRRGVSVYFGGPNVEDIPSHRLFLHGDYFASDGSVSGGRDVNGDGYPDFVIGNGSSALVYFGGPGLDSIPDVILQGFAPSFYGTSVSEGDVNGDGVADVIVGASGSGSPTSSDPGHVYVYDLSVPLRARAFVRSEHRTIALTDVPSQIYVQFEPVNGDYENADVDLSSLRLVSTGTGDVSEISAVASKRTIEGDTDRDGSAELTACFGRSDLSRLFSSVRGRRTIEVALEGRLEHGRKFRAPLTLTILGTGKPNGLIASVAPNPLNPCGMLTFAMRTPGSVTVRLYDISGRFVRTVIAAEQFPPGIHTISIDGRDERGTAFASGVYFYRLETPDGVTHGRFVVAK